MSRHSEESEKAIEAYLVELARREGFLALKWYSTVCVGYPDRLVLLPGGKTFWIELKSKGEKPRQLQEICIRRLRDLGQTVYVCDSKEAVLHAVRDQQGKPIEPHINTHTYNLKFK